MSQIAEKNETYSQEVGTLRLDIPTGEFLWNFLIYPKNDIILDSTLIIRIIYIYTYIHVHIYIYMYIHIPDISWLQNMLPFLE